MSGVSSVDLYQRLQITKRYRLWINAIKNNPVIIEGRDYIPAKKIHTPRINGRKKNDYMFTRECAVSICVLTGTRVSLRVRIDIESEK